jgi:hypothetical protein
MYDITTYIKNHSIYFKQYREKVSSDILAFDVSFLDLQFLDRNIEETMKSLLSKLREKTIYEVKNGFNLNKYGQKIQAYTHRVIELEKVVQAEAIHTYDIDGKATMPHFHFLIDPSARLGKDYSLLKKHVEEVSKEFHLRPHFAEESKGEKKLMLSVKKFTWHITKTTDKNFKNIVQDGRLKKGLDLLLKYSSKTDNLTYYIKTLENVKIKLKRTKQDFIWHGYNLKHIYPIPLSTRDKDVIDIIKNHPTKKEIKKHFDHPIMRDYIRYSSNTTKAYIIESIKRQTTIFNHLKKSQETVRKYKEIQKDMWEKDLFTKEKLYKDLIIASTQASNEKQLKLTLQKKGYTGLGFSKIGGKKVGIFYYHNRKKKSITFKELGISWRKITANLMNQEKEQLTHTKPSYQTKLLFDYYHAHIKFDFSGYYISKNKKDIKIENKQKEISIIDKGSQIISKKSKNTQEQVSLMLKIAFAKGWEINNIDASGSHDFRKEFEKQKEEILKKDLHNHNYKALETIANKRKNDEKQIRDLKKKLDRNQTRARSIIADAQEAERRYADSTKKSIQEKYGEFETEISRRREQNEKIAAEIARRERENRELQIKLNHTTTEIKKLESDIRTRRGEGVQLETELTKQKHFITELENNISELTELRKQKELDELKTENQNIGYGGMSP